MITSNFNIYPLTQKDLPDLLKFCDREIGVNYFNLSSLEAALHRSLKNGKNSSFIAFTPDDKEIIGVRLTYAPGNWLNEVKKGFSSDLWKVDPNELAYFKSLFINEKYQKHGLGRRLSQMAIAVLKEQGAKAILSHSSLNSPNNSSQKYLQRMGFQPLREHLKFWEDVDYFCTHCGQRPCQCSALEMILYL